MKHHILPLFGFVFLAGCGGGGTDDTDTATPYTGSCGIGTAKYALASGSTSVSDSSFTISGEADTSAFCAENSGTSITLGTTTIISSASSSSATSSNLYGLAAAVLAYGSSATSASGGTVAINSGTITTSSDYANGAFASGKGSTIALSDMDIATSGSYARATVAARGGKVTVTGGSALSSDTAEAAVVEGASTMTIGSSDVASGFTTRGIYIYDSSTGSGPAALTMSDGTYTYSGSGAAFYVYGQTATISLNGVALTSTGSSLLTVVGTGSQSSEVTLAATAQSLAGNIVANSYSTMSVSLTSGSALSGAINSANSGATVDLTLDSTSSLALTGNSYINTLDVADCSKIAYNGHNLYYKAFASGSAACSSSYLLTY